MALWQARRAGWGQAPPPQPVERLYQQLVAALLAAQGFEAGDEALRGEWAPLAGLLGAMAPGYFTARQMTQTLDQCPPLPPGPRREVETTLTRFFQGMAEGLPPWLAQPLMSPAATLAWAGLFPPGLGWAGLSAARRAGYRPLGAWESWRAWRRHDHGELHPLGEPTALEAWHGLLQGEEHPHPLDFLAEQFARAHCHDFPQCGVCPLANHCRVAAQAQEGPKGLPGLWGCLEQGEGEQLSVEQLLEALFAAEHAPLTGWKPLLQPLRKLAVLGPVELADLVPQAAPGRLMALFELARRFNEERLTPGVSFATAKDIHRHFRVRLRDAQREQFLVVMLDAQRRYLGDYLVSLGTQDRSLVHPREVFAPAIRGGANALVVVHNHPSGDPSPSKEDLNVTLRLVDAGDLIGIPVLDHVIVGGETFVSLGEKNLLHPHRR